MADKAKSQTEEQNTSTGNESKDSRPEFIRKMYPKPLTPADLLLSQGLVSIEEAGVWKQIPVEEAQKRLDEMDNTKKSLQDALKGVNNENS